MRVTFIIAHHNYQQYLEGCIMSALKQTYKNIHVCIIDDCSDDPDSVIDIFERCCDGAPFNIEYTKNSSIFTSEYLTLILLEKESGSYHQAYARNRGMEHCWNNTDVFAILDADDENYNTKIEKCVDVLKNDNNIGAVYTDTNIVNVETDRLIREYREPYDHFRLLQECIVHSGCVIKKEALQAVLENGKVFDEDLPPCEDYDLWIRIAEKFLFYHIPEALVYVRVHPNNSTNTTTHEHRVKMIQRIFEKKQQRLQ